MEEIKELKCPKCKVKLKERVKYSKDTQWYECPRCGEDYYHIDGFTTIIRGPIDGWFKESETKDVFEAGCICNNCGTMYRKDARMPLFEEFDIRYGNSEYFTGCAYCKTDAYLSDIEDDEDEESFNIKPKTARKSLFKKLATKRTATKKRKRLHVES